MLKKIIPFIIAAMLVSCIGGSEARSAVPQEIYIPEDLMGMVHAGYGNGWSDKLDEEYALLDEMGVRWMMRDFLWKMIQPEKGVWEWGVFDKYVSDAKDHNKKIMGLLCYDVPWIHGEFNTRTKKYACGHSERQVRIGIIAGEDEVAAFCEYVRETVLRYKDDVEAWCIWNEPNISDNFWSGSVKEFFALSKAAAAAIREADPDAIIVGGSLNPGADNNVWTKGLFTSGAMDQVDFIAYHPYSNNAAGSAAAYVKFRDYVSKYGFENKVWVTEVGYPLDKGPGGYDSKVPEALMPEMTVKTITLLAAAGARRISWYELFDYGADKPANDSEAWFGLVNFDTFTKKGGGEAYQLCARNLPGKTLRPALPERAGVPKTIEAYYFEGSDGTHCLIVWNNNLSNPRQITVTLPGSNQQAWNVSNGASAAIAETSTHTLQRGASLQFFTWENNDTSKFPIISTP